MGLWAQQVKHCEADSEGKNAAALCTFPPRILTANQNKIGAFSSQHTHKHASPCSEIQRFHCFTFDLVFHHTGANYPALLLLKGIYGQLRYLSNIILQ